MVCAEWEEWPKEKRSEIMFSFFVSDMHSRKLQQRLNEKLWLVENYFRTHGTWRSNGPFHSAQHSQNPSKSIDIDLNLTTFAYPPLLHHPHITTMSCPLLPLDATRDTSVHAAPHAGRMKLPSCVWYLGSPRDRWHSISDAGLRFKVYEDLIQRGSQFSPNIWMTNS